MVTPLFKQGERVLYTDFKGVYFRVEGVKTTPDDKSYYDLVLVTKCEGAPEHLPTVPEYLLSPLIVSQWDEEDI